MGQDEIHDEKRLVITADFNGQVVSVERPEASVFDFVAGDLVGTSLCDTVDIFADVSCVQRKTDADCSAMGWCCWTQWRVFKCCGLVAHVVNTPIPCTATLFRSCSGASATARASCSC